MAGRMWSWSKYLCVLMTNYVYYVQNDDTVAGIFWGDFI